MAKRYDPIMCMMVDEPTKARDVAPATQRYINTIVDESKANAEKFVRQAEQDDEVPENELKYVYKAYNEKFGYKFHDSASTLDKAIKACDASTGHKVVVFVENYLRSIGKNNSTGKYDKIVQGVRSLLSQSLLDDEGLKKAAEHEADRLLKKYNL